jgi:hypothetical protein
VIGAASHHADVVSVEAYDPLQDAWQRVESPNHPRGGFGAALGRDGRIYLVAATE